MQGRVPDTELTFATRPQEPPHELKRSLQPRHLNMIAIGGCGLSASGVPRFALYATTAIGALR